MKLPLLIPENLQVYSIAQNDEDLLRELTKLTLDAILFFEYASEDEIWAEAHPVFMREIIFWFSRNAFEGNLSTEQIKSIEQTIHRQYLFLKPFIPLTITIKHKEHDWKVNNLLLGASSPYFQDLLFNECRDKGQTVLVMDEIDPKMIFLLEEYLCFGKIEMLWKTPAQEIRSIITQMAAWGLNSLCEECENILKRYITRENVADTLIEAQIKGWVHLKDACIDLINTHHSGARFGKTDTVESLEFEFLDFKEDSKDIFQQFKSLITHLIFGGTLIQDPHFSKVIHECPKLVGIDLSRTTVLSDRMSDLPSRLKELDISHCPWLTTNALRTIFKTCPNLEKVSLSSNVHIPSSAWPELQKLRRLKSLNISRCQQISDQELRLIAQSCQMLNDLSMENCTKITDRGLFDIPKTLPALYSLNIAFNDFSDSPLIEFALHCKNLRVLNISHCSNITDKGILEFIRLWPFLNSLNLTDTSIHPDTIKRIQNLNPHLQIRFIAP